MNTYKLNLKGTKKTNTQDIQVFINANNKGQAFNLAYAFFQKGRTEQVYGNDVTGLKTIEYWMPNAKELRPLAGRYIVYQTSIEVVK